MRRTRQRHGGMVDKALRDLDDLQQIRDIDAMMKRAKRERRGSPMMFRLMRSSMKQRLARVEGRSVRGPVERATMIGGDTMSGGTMSGDTISARRRRRRQQRQQQRRRQRRLVDMAAAETERRRQDAEIVKLRARTANMSAERVRHWR